MQSRYDEVQYNLCGGGNRGAQLTNLKKYLPKITELQN